MYPHHQASIQQTVTYFQNDPEVQALLLGGSVAHGFAGSDSDIDVMMIVADQDYEKRSRDGSLTFFNQQLCTYPEGYVDGKYIGFDFLKQVAGQGSEPARFAFLDAQVLFSRLENLPELLQSIARYPVEGKEARLERFYAQFEAWHWYTSQGLKQDNPYLLWFAVGKLVLFGGRLVLAHNEILYPYHKWFLKVLEQAPDKPATMLSDVQRLYVEPSAGNIERFYELVKGFRTWGKSETRWPHQFMVDSELNWLGGAPPIDDL